MVRRHALKAEERPQVVHASDRWSCRECDVDRPQRGFFSLPGRGRRIDGVGSDVRSTLAASLALAKHDAPSSS